MRLYQRTWALEVQTTTTQRYEGMRLRFSARYPRDAAAAACGLTVWMPSADLVRRLSDTSAEVRVYAGYGDDATTEIMRGRVAKGSLADQRGSAEPYVAWDIHASRAELTGRLALVLPGVVTTTEAIEAVRAAMGAPADVIQVGHDVASKRGRVYTRTPRAALRELCAESGSSWSMPGGRLRVWPRGGEATLAADGWGPGTGLVDVSGLGTDGRIEARALLRPAMRPGDRVQIDDRRHRGIVVVEEVSHDGDSDQDSWHTAIVGRAA